MRGLFLACFGALSTVAFGCDGVTVSIPTADHRTMTAWSGSRVGPEARVNNEPLRDVIREVQTCRALHTDWEIVKFAIFSTEQDQNRFMHPSRGTHFSFDSWKAEYARINPRAMAMVLIVGNSVVARKLSSAGAPAAISGKFSPDGHFEPDTPLSTTAMGIEISDVLDIIVRKRPDAIPGTPAGNVVVYAKAKMPLRHTPTDSFRRSLVSLLMDVKFPNVDVLISNDTWFINDPGFPIVYPFEPKRPAPQAPPDSTIVSCTRNRVDFSCDLVP